MDNSSNPSNKGMALVVTLAAVALLTVLVTAFFARSLLNRQISFSSTNLTKADFAAHSALDIIVGELRNEIANPTHSTLTGSRPYYIPKTTTDVLPRAAGLSSASGSLTKVSTSGVPFAPGSSLTGSPVSTGIPSKNGRSLSTARWFSSAGSPLLGSNNVVPDWIYMTRENGLKTPIVAEAKDRTGPGYVIGRFAYCVYDIGGLLDVNVSGYPTSASSNAPFKSSSVYADLSAVGVGSSQNFVSWRNASTGTDATTFQEWASGVSPAMGSSNEAALAAERSGHRLAVMGDNAVFSRGDLLSNPHLGGAESNLTHFTRSINGATPSGSSAIYSISGWVTHYLDDGTTETYYVGAGDQLLQRRFSLSKLAWLTWRGPKPGISAEAIQSCFGLRWNEADPANKFWEYVGASGASVQPQIKTLDDVRSENSVREPNFFELLKSGIVPGSVGKASTRRTMALPEQLIREGVADLQILRVGANVIDSADEDNYPTTIVVNYAGLDVPVHGVEDLPYLYGLNFGRIGLDTVVDSTHQAMQHCSLLMAPILFNPHAPSPFADNQSPSAVRVRIAGGAFSSVYWQPLGPALGTPLARAVTQEEGTLTNRSVIQVPASAFEAFRSKMSVIRGSNATTNTRLDSFDSSISAQDADVHGFHYYSYKDLPETYPIYDSAGRPYGGNVMSQLGNLLIVIEYQDPENPNVWHVYDTLAGNEAFTVTGITDGSGQTMSFGPGINRITVGTSKSVPSVGGITMKFDPRTTRFGAGRGSVFFTTTASPIPSTTVNGLDTYLPFGTGSVNGGTAPVGVYPGLWAEGNRTNWTGLDGLLITNVADVDNVTRPADAWLNGADANLFRNYTDLNRRPILLQHAFRSVGEMGYVFRDSPWKTLSFFDESSGDGALLDLFSIVEQTVIAAGRVNLNSRQPLTQKALLSGSGQSVDGSSQLAAPAALAAAYQSFAFTDGQPTTNLPATLGGLPKFLSSTELNSAYPTISNPIKSRRESIIRALAGSSQTRTWNLLIDVVAQTGKYSPSATSMDEFVVEGQKRYWLSVAIDRYTGKILAQQLEPVYD